MKRNKFYSSIAAARKCSLVCMAVSLAGPGFAQNADTNIDPNESDRKNIEEIVVTGTLIRGTAPAGANVIGLSAEDVQSTSAINATQLLQTVPQMGSFNNLESPRSGFNFVTTNRPNLRNLPGSRTAGSSPTLVLIDGRRIVGMGITSTTPDPDIIPPGVLERVEIVPDGGSAIYGSDAVAGVINFITRRDFDGVEVDVRHGIGDEYDTTDYSLTGGNNWGSGSAYISYNHSEHDAIFGRDRDFSRLYPRIVPGFPEPVTALECSPGNVRAFNILTGQTLGVAAVPYGPGEAVLGSSNQCDITDSMTIYPKEGRDSVMVGLSQEINEKLSLDVRGFYMDRGMEQANQSENIATLTYIGPFATPSPYFDDHRLSASPFEHHDIYLQTAGSNRFQKLDTETFGIYPTLTAELGGSWQLRAAASYGESESENHVPGANASARTTATATGLLNPYDVPSSNPQAIDAINNWETFGSSKQKLMDINLVADGELFSMPGGEVKLAVGAEYLEEHLESQVGETVPGYEDSGYPGLMINGIPVVAPLAPLPNADLDRDVRSIFGELVFPLVGDVNAMTGVRELTLSISGRYDDYSDVGSTTNPKIGLTFRPIEWVTLRSAWGESFVAPSLADNEQTALTSGQFIPSAVTFLFPPAGLIASGQYPAIQPGETILIMLGNRPGTFPQEAETFSFGVDLEPPAIPGLELGATYWKIKYEGIIGVPSFTNQSVFWANPGPFVTVAPTQQEVDDLLAISANGPTPCTPLPDCVYAVVDARKTNTGDFELDGLDMTAFYLLPTSFGTMDFSFNANYELNRESSTVSGGPMTDLLDANTSRLHANLGIGAQVGNFRAQATLFHSAGYDLDPFAGVAPQQTEVDDFNVVNLFFKYDLEGQGLLSDLSLTLNVDNVFDEDPPEYRVYDTLVYPNNGFTNGHTVGRLFQLGMRKKF